MLKISILFALPLLASCATPPPEEHSPPVTSRGVPEQDAAGSEIDAPFVEKKATAQDSLQTMRELTASARAAFDTNHPMEALRHLVGVLAADEMAPAETVMERAAERTELVRKADAELTAVGGRLTLEPTDEWTSPGGRVAGDTRELSMGKGPQPSVRLVINYDFGKAVVADAPIRFGFTEGTGEVSGQATTDAYGVASATVRSLSRTDRAAVIRAALVVANKNSTREFPDVFQDFTYLPPGRTARILASERPISSLAGSLAASSGASSPLADAVSRGLAGAALEMLPVSGEEATGAGGYLVSADTEYEEARQMVNKGRAYDIFTVAARTRVRIFRSDGSVAVARPELRSVGRGGTAAAALEAVLAASRQAVEKDLRGAAAEIRKVLD